MNLKSCFLIETLISWIIIVITVSVVALTTLALKKPELFENNAQPQTETSPIPSPGPEYKNETNQPFKPFDLGKS